MSGSATEDLAAAVFAVGAERYAKYVGDTVASGWESAAGGGAVVVGHTLVCMQSRPPSMPVPVLPAQTTDQGLMAAALRKAAAQGTPFCEECAKRRGAR